MFNSRQEVVLAGNFQYGVAAGPPSVDLRTNEPAGQIIVAFSDNDAPGNGVQVVMGEDSARDLAMKILDQLKRGTMPGVILPGQDGRR